jgi:hypothetical protein
MFLWVSPRNGSRSAWRIVALTVRQRLCRGFLKLGAPDNDRRLSCRSLAKDWLPVGNRSAMQSECQADRHHIDPRRSDGLEDTHSVAFCKQLVLDWLPVVPVPNCAA